MLAAERRNRIIERIAKDKTIRVNKLSKEFDVSEETVRRDLEKLEKRGYLLRTYGGAVLPEESNREFPVDVRQTINIEKKVEMAHLARALINDGDTIFIDASSSAYYLSKRLKEKKDLVVITNAIKVVLEFAEVKDITVISTGGHLAAENLSYYGEETISVLEKYNVDKAIFSCKAVSVDKGITDSNEMISNTHKVMIQNSKKSILLCDDTKFDKVSFINTSSFDDIDILVTNKNVNERYKELIKKSRVDLVLPNIK